MAKKNFIKPPARPSTRTIGFSEFQLASPQQGAKRTKMVIDLAIKTRQLTEKDIQNWRMAWQIAINIENPKRNRLLDVYTDVMIDLHLSGAIGNRKSKTLSKSFKIINVKTGEENDDLTDLLDAYWFKSFISLSLDSIWYGHSLIEFGNIITDPKLMFDRISLLPREHVIPEYNRIVKDASDEWKKGIDYTAPPFSSWCLPVGDPKDLGLLLKVAPQAISKKNMAAYWDQFGEIFGMPIRIGTTSSRDPKERTKVETMLSEMGAAAWGLFPDGTKVEIVETTRGDAYQVYDKRIERCNSEMSKIITGVTMTMDNGSSRSQGEVHERQFLENCQADADMIRDIINTRLFPFLRQHGFSFEGHRFDWDESIDYNPEQQLAIDQMLIDNFDVDPEYFIKKYSVPILGKKQLKDTEQSFFS